MITIVRRAILAADPAIVETEKWNSPNFVYNGVDRVTLRVRPTGGLQVIFHRGSTVREDAAAFHFDDPTGLLTWPAPDRGVLAIADTAEAEAYSAEITQLVRRWIATA